MNSQSAIGDSWRFAAFDATKKAVKAKDFEFVYIFWFLLADVFTGLQHQEHLTVKFQTINTWP